MDFHLIYTYPKDDAVADSDVWQHPEKKKNKLANKSRSDVLL